MAVTRRQTSTTAASGQGNGKGVDPFAAHFNKTEANAFEQLPIGTWESLATKGGMYEKDGVKSAWIEFTVVQKGVTYGKTGRAFFTLVDKFGDINDVGVAILKRSLLDMEKIDEDGISSEKHLEEILQSFEKSPVWVDILVTLKKGYTNIRIQKVHEDQSEMPENPNSGDDIPM